jgi:amylosucrase
LETNRNYLPKPSSGSYLIAVDQAMCDGFHPGMAILGEAIVAPKEITKYFGTGEFTAQECDFAYNAVHMALQWDMLATGETEVMMAAQHEILKKPYGTSWITYTRCHDDIGLGL